jgi:hypothetical protein
MGRGPGRVFATVEAAVAWCREKYGDNVHPVTYEGGPRWVVLIKNLRR